MSDEQAKADDGVWCVIANVKRDHGAEERSGTRQFRGGTKIYIAGCYAGTCNGVVAIGLQRKSRKFITCVVSVNHVENFRVKLVYHPKVLDLIEHDDRCWIRTKDEAETWAAAFPEWQRIWQKTTEEKPGRGNEGEPWKP